MNAGDRIFAESARVLKVVTQMPRSLAASPIQIVISGLSLMVVSAADCAPLSDRSTRNDHGRSVLHATIPDLTADRTPQFCVGI
ncbi:hypothetical protein [Tychonema sp. LEGE 07203]|uniref:hypothetical protein n=1 Tax=Tychonema sp. LEGE 07203 TaxID=1828671 RepID=UPI00188199DF|nr:hypothetical protein [Tychonema sp. LEGE 07203]MBE9096330.1 hypothetical protein [Tychonema sp. LEGE 07203]